MKNKITKRKTKQLDLLKLAAGSAPTPEVIMPCGIWALEPGPWMLHVIAMSKTKFQVLTTTQVEFRCSSLRKPVDFDLEIMA